MRYLLRRFMSAIPVWLGVTALAFGLIHLLPGDPATVILGLQSSPAKRHALDRQLGLDQSLPMQFIHWLERIFQGNFGHSLITGQPVVTEISGKLTPTAELIVLAFVIALGLGLPLGVLSARRGGKVSDFAARIIALLGLSVPSFVFGTILIIVAAVVAPNVRMIGYIPFGSRPLASVEAMFWPALTLALTVLAVVVRYTRVALRDALREEYTVTAQAMGLRARTYVYKNALRNALLPLLGAVSAQVAYLVGGVVVIEDVFNIPGLGSLTLNAVNQRDYTLLQGIVVLVATGVIVVNLVTDALYLVIDPRLRHG